jgi:Family of unknown function (DUF6083)
MRSTNNHAFADHAWDSSFKNRRPQRNLRVDKDNHSRLLRAGQRAPCTGCGNPVDWHYHPDNRPVPLHPHELPTTAVPPTHRWHLAQGIAYPIPDGTPWCRISHLAICPALPADSQPVALHHLRRELAVLTRRLLETGRFTPTAPTPPSRTRTADTPVRHIVRILRALYLAPGPATDVRCVAQTTKRTRCTRPLDTHPDHHGRWIIIEVPRSSGPRHLADYLVGTAMAVFDLDRLPYTEQLRWRTQHCPAHAASTAADTTLTQWEPFDAFAHSIHITSMPPPSARPSHGPGTTRIPTPPQTAAMTGARRPSPPSSPDIPQTAREPPKAPPAHAASKSVRRATRRVRLPGATT